MPTASERPSRRPPQSSMLPPVAKVSVIEGLTLKINEIIFFTNITENYEQVKVQGLLVIIPGCKISLKTIY